MTRWEKTSFLKSSPGCIFGIESFTSKRIKEFLKADKLDPSTAKRLIRKELDKGDKDAFLVALHDVAEAHGMVASTVILKHGER